MTADDAFERILASLYEAALDALLPADRSRLRRLPGRALPDLWGEAPSGGSMTVQRSSGGSRLALHVSPPGDRAADFGRTGWR